MTGKWMRRLAPAALGVIATIATAFGSWWPSYWGDEAASVMTAARSVPQILGVVANIDAVHAIYYLGLHYWMALFGDSEFATRLPSAIAVGLTVAGIVVLVARIGTMRIALLAGAIAIAIPRLEYNGTEARSYALTTAAAVWLTVLLLHVLERHPTAGRWWALYGVAMAAACSLFLFVAPLTAAHLVTVWLLRRRFAVRRWWMAPVTVVVLALPIVIAGVAQREQVAFLAQREYATAQNVLVTQWFIEGTPIAAVCWTLIALGVVGVVLLRGRAGSLTLISAIAIPWLVVPTVLLLLLNVAQPAYNMRYLSYSTPAVAIASAVGIAVLARVIRRRRVALTVGAALAVGLIASGVPPWVQARTLYAKDGGSDWRELSEYMSAHARAGDDVVFGDDIKPSRSPLLAARVYPAGFAGLDLPQVVTPYTERPALWDLTRPLTEYAATLGSTVWLIPGPDDTGTPPELSYLTKHGFRVADEVMIHRSVVYELERVGSEPDPTRPA